MHQAETGFGLHLLFDDSFNEQIHRAWDALEHVGIATPSSAPHGRAVPHLALTVVELPPDDAALKRLDRLRSPLAKGVVFSHFGLLPTADGFELFIGTVLDRALVSAHGEMMQVLKFDRHSPDYALGMWTPRCTLAERVEASQVSEALEALPDLSLPQHVDVVAVAFVETMTGMAIPVW
jgi:hypothetical protein